MILFSATAAGRSGCAGSPAGEAPASAHPVSRLPAEAACIKLSEEMTETVGAGVDALINYGARYRSRLSISSSRAEGRVDEIANARMAKK